MTDKHYITTTQIRDLKQEISERFSDQNNLPTSQDIRDLIDLRIGKNQEVEQSLSKLISYELNKSEDGSISFFNIAGNTHKTIVENTLKLSREHATGRRKAEISFEVEGDDIYRTMYQLARELHVIANTIEQDTRNGKFHKVEI